MNTTDVQFGPAQRQLRAYEESWRADHAVAMFCGGVEDLLASGLSGFQMLERVNCSWRDRVFRGTQEYTSEADAALQGLFRSWLVVTGHILDIVPDLEERFGNVEGAAEARRCVAEAHRLLDQWQPPRLATAVGLRDMTLTPQAAADLDRFVEETTANPPPMPTRRLETRDASFLK
jgi:hypothetical protein